MVLGSVLYGVVWVLFGSTAAGVSCSVTLGTLKQAEPRSGIYILYICICTVVITCCVLFFSISFAVTFCPITLSGNRAIFYFISLCFCDARISNVLLS